MTSTNLIRNLRVGEPLSFDGGRIKVELEYRSGNAARLRLTLAEDVVVDKPRTAANDDGAVRYTPLVIRKP